MVSKKPTDKKASICRKGSAAHTYAVICLFMFSQTLFAQGGTHPGFDPDFGLFAPIENRILLGLFAVVAIAAIYLTKTKRQKKH